MSEEKVQLSKKELKAKRKDLNAQRKEAMRLEKERRRHLPVTESCKGCGAYMSLDQRFCSECGAKRLYNRLNWRVLITDFTDRFLNVEAQFPKTFVALFTKPEDVIDGYINGSRKKYLSAFSYFAISLTLNGIYIFILRTWYLDDALLQESIKIGDPQASNAYLNWIKNFVDIFLDFQSLITLLSLPLLALISKLVFWNYKKYNFVEHVVIYLYTYSHVQIITVVIGMFFYWSSYLQMTVSWILSIGMFIYMAFVLKRMFGLTIEKILLKTLLFFMISGVLVILIAVISVFFGVYLFKSGALDGIEIFESFKSLVKNQVEMQKTLKEAGIQAKDSIRMDSIKNATQVVKDSLPQLLKDSTKILAN